MIKANRADVERIRRWERKQAREREQERERIAQAVRATDGTYMGPTSFLITEVLTNVDANGCVQTFTQ